MADNVTLNSGSGGATVATDECVIGGSTVQVQRVKPVFGTDGNATDVSTSNPLPVSDAGGSITVDAVSLPLPTGASTSANQTTEITHLAAIEAAVEGTLAVSAASLPLPSGAATAAKQPALGTAGTPSSDVLTVQGHASGTALKVDGSAVTQPVSAASLPLPSGAATAANQSTAITHLAAIETAVEGTLTVGTHAVTQSGTWTARCQDGSGNALTSKVAGSERAITVAVVDTDGNQVTSFGGSGGSGTEYTEDTAAAGNPVGGALILVRDDSRAGSLTTTNGDNVAARGTNSGELYVKHVDSIPVTDNGSTLSIDDGGGIITVDGTVAATQSGTWNVTNISGTVSLPTGAATAAKQPALGTAGSASADVITVQGVASMTPLLVNGSGVTQPVSGSVTANAGTNLNTSALALESGGNLAAAATSLGLLDNAVSGNELQVDIVAALPAGTNNIGDVDVLTLPGVAGTVAHNTADSGNPVKVGFQATNALPTAVANGDRVNAIADLFGRQLVGFVDPAMVTWKSGNYTTSQTGTALWTPASGKRIAISSIVISAYGTTAGRVLVWFGSGADTTYTAGTDQLVLPFNAAPGDSSKPGISFTPTIPIYCTTADHVLRVTSDANISIDVIVNGWEW